jgi:hypothetical protein
VGSVIGLSWLSCAYWRASSRRGPNSVRSRSRETGARQVAVGLVAVGLALELDRRHDRRDALGPHLRGARGVGDVRDDLQRAPQAGRARAGDRVQAEVEDLLQRAGEERRHVQRRERRLAGAGQRRGLARRVVADERQRPPLGCVPAKFAWRSASIARSRPGFLPYQTPVTPSRFGPGQVHRQLRAVDRGGRELLVEAGREVQRVVGAELAQAQDLLVQAAERRALVARDERGGVQAAAAGRRGAGRAARARAPGCPR